MSCSKRSVENRKTQFDDDFICSCSVRGGFGFLHVAIAALIGSPIAGALLNAAGGSYVPPLCFGGAMATLGVCLLVVGRRGVQRRKEARMGVKTWRV